MKEISELVRHSVLPPRPQGPETRSWRLIVNGQEIEFDHALLVLDTDNPRKPKTAVECGLIDDGRYQYDGLRFVELGGGGVALVPYIILRGELWIATTLQYRLLLGREEPGLIRGYKPPGVAASEHVLTEAVEEFGKSVLAGGEPFPLVGAPVNPASHIIDTRPLPNEPNPGGYMFGVPLSLDCIDLLDGMPILKAEHYAPTDKLEALSRGRIMPWWEAVQYRDGVLATGTARLMATLHARRKLLVTVSI